ncbi:MAG: cyclase family protein [Chloroflexi bacterium]|nr:cyclase family protein [Chloroflexota bacterium]MQC19056.1 cyclase family protein [Chloroflexota bacterium]
MGLKDRVVTTPAEFEEYRTRLNNWGRWGADDQFGTLNHITPEARAYAASLVRDGRTVSCANPIATEALVPDQRRNRNPADHRMMVSATGCGDYVGLYYHGFVNTHIDALCHIFTGPGGQTYNGLDSAMVTDEGAESLSVDRWRHGIVTRGVLYDIPRMRGHDYVRLGEQIEGWDLEDWAKQVGVTPRPGDAVFIRSGADPFWSANPDFEMEFPPLNTPGVGVSCLEYLYDHDAALMGWDLQEASDQDQYGERIPVHAIAIPLMGMPLVDNANLEFLSEACAETGRYEFLVTIAPLVVLGGTGSPVNPIATL